MNLLHAVLELGQMRSAHIYCFLLYSFSLKVSCEDQALIFCTSRNTLKLGDKNKVDSSISDREGGCKTSVSFAGLVSCTVAWK